MNAPLLAVLVTAVVAAASAAPSESPVRDLPSNVSGDTLRAFASEAEFREFLRRYAPPRRLRQVAPTADGLQLEAAVATAAPASESVTNVQHAGVDEGGIVKVHGDHLVILRRGRLFTVAIGDDALRPISAVDAFGADVDPARTWYDELIVYGDVVAVVGYSYERGGTEIGLFRIDPAGQLRHRSTYQLRSHDYYSSRNYASRLIGSKLIFYAPVQLPVYGDDPARALPAMRRWQGRGSDGEFRRILPATRIYHAGLPPETPVSLVLHTVTTCDLARRELACDARAVAGPPGRVFYVSAGSVYVWTSSGRRGGGARAAAMLYRMPLDGAAPSALRVSGSPVDQFSFLEGDDGHLNVLVRSASWGEGMWSAEWSRGDVALLRFPLERFGDGSGAAPAWDYRALPTPEGHSFRNRFVGQQLLYGTGSGWGRRRAHESGTLYAVPLGGGDVAQLRLAHGVDRIEAMGGNAVVVGSAGDDLHFTSVRLAGSPGVVDSYVSRGAAQGELRSHGFFYRADGADNGILGLPVREPGKPGYVHLFDGSASVLFLHNQDARFQPLGQLGAGANAAREDGCRASCVDWYGNARPLFPRGRILALLGYELVEGRLERGEIRELRRVSFAPAGARSPGPASD
jgi:hypothetical protein